MARKTLIQVRRDTVANWAAVAPALGEPVFETDTGNLRMGDGSTVVPSLAKFIHILSADISDGQVVKWDNASSKFIGHTLAAGHTQNTDTGTTGNTFTIDSDSATGKIILDVALNAGEDHTMTITNAVMTADVVITVPATTGTLALVSQLHTQNTDTGTTSAAFQLLTGSAGVKLKSSSGILEVRNGADDAYADFKCKDLIVTGTTLTVNAETVTVDDNIIVLNNNVTGTPTEDGGIQVERGTSTNASLIFVESTDKWCAGLLGSEVPILLSGDAPTAHNLIDTTGHPVSGLTTGHFLKATGAATYAFAAHGLTYTDVGAASSGHTHTGVYVAQPGSEEQGDMLIYGAAAYAVVHHGTQYQVWLSGGHGVNPSWGDIDGGSA